MKKITKIFMALLVVSSMLFTMFATVACTPKDSCAEGHTPNAVAQKEATCTEKGNEAYWKCSVCNKLFSDAACTNEINAVPEIAAKGHGTANDEGKCPVCGVQIAEPKPAAPFATEAFNGFLTSGGSSEEDTLITFIFSDSGPDSLSEGYAVASLLYGVDDLTTYAYTLENNTLTFYTLDEQTAAVGTDSCGTGTIDGKNLTFSVKYTPDEEGATEQTATFNAEMYKLTITGAENLDTETPIAASQFVGKDTLVAFLIVWYLGDETITFNGTKYDEEDFYAVKMPAQDSTLDIGAAPINYGTENDPLTVARAVEDCKALGTSGTYSSEYYYVKGIVVSKPTRNGTSAYGFQIKDSLEDDNVLEAYYVYLEEGVDIPAINDTVTIHGKLEFYQSGSYAPKYEITASKDDDPQAKVIKNERGTSDITKNEGAGTHIELSATSGLNGSTFTFTVTTDEQYEITSVKVNNEVVEPTSENNYTGTISGPTEVVALATIPVSGDITENVSFVTNFATYAKGWDSQYGERTLSASDFGISSLDFTVALKASKQTGSNAAITDRPVVASKKDEGFVTITLNGGKHIKSFTFNLREWSSNKKFVTLTLQYQIGSEGAWTDVDSCGIKDLSSAVAVTNYTVLTATNLPTGVTAVRFMYKANSSSNQQVGLTGFSITVGD